MCEMSSRPKIDLDHQQLERVFYAYTPSIVETSNPVERSPARPKVETSSENYVECDSNWMSEQSK
jgi:hypothetical protein